jgi:hypothetical protein
MASRKPSAVDNELPTQTVYWNAKDFLLCRLQVESKTTALFRLRLSAATSDSQRPLSILFLVSKGLVKMLLLASVEIGPFSLGVFFGFNPKCLLQL